MRCRRPRRFRPRRRLRGRCTRSLPRSTRSDHVAPDAESRTLSTSAATVFHPPSIRVALCPRVPLDEVVVALGRARPRAYRDVSRRAAPSRVATPDHAAVDGIPSASSTTVWPKPGTVNHPEPQIASRTLSAVDVAGVTRPPKPSPPRGPSLVATEHRARRARSCRPGPCACRFTAASN